MFSRKVVFGLAAFVVITVLVGQSLFGAGGVGVQRPQRGVQRPQRPQRPGETGRVQRDPQQMREQMQRMMVQRMKRQLEIADEKWETVQPLLEKVVQLNAQLNSGALGGMYGMLGGFGGRGMGAGGRGDPGMQAGQGRNRPVGEGQTTERGKTDLQKAADELQGLLRSFTAESDAIAAKLAAYRNAKNKVKEDLAKAQGALKAQITTPKQEARLVLMGLLN